MNKQNTLKQIGLRVKKIRKGKNISQKDLAFMCGFEKASMCRIEGGKTNLSILTLLQICNALSLTLKEFFNWQE